MATKVDIAGTSISASQMSEFWRVAALPGKHINKDTFQAYIEGRDPFAFERNEHGHIVLTLTGLDLIGAQEIERLESAGFRFGTYAKQCLTSTEKDSYDANHRLVAGQIYKVALMPTKEVEVVSERTTANLRKRGIEHYGYGRPLAGIVPRYRERISDKQMEEMGFRYIAAPHDPIEDADGAPDVLCSRCDRGGQWVRTDWGRPARQWLGAGAFAFLVPAS